MSYRIRIKSGTLSVEAELNESSTAKMIWDALPIVGEVNTWGDEIYFGIPVKAERAPDARADVEVGELGYWPVGKAFCIFFGPTPASSGSKPRAASPVNIVGRVLGDATLFRQVRDGASITLERAE